MFAKLNLFNPIFFILLVFLCFHFCYVDAIDAAGDSLKKSILNHMTFCKQTKLADAKQAS